MSLPSSSLPPPPPARQPPGAGRWRREAAAPAWDPVRGGRRCIPLHWNTKQHAHLLAHWGPSFRMVPGRGAKATRPGTCLPSGLAAGAQTLGAWGRARAPRRRLRRAWRARAAAPRRPQTPWPPAGGAAAEKECRAEHSWRRHGTCRCVQACCVRAAVTCQKRPASQKAGQPPPPPSPQARPGPTCIQARLAL